MKFTTSEVSEVTSGVLHGTDRTVDGVATDSRSIRGEELFVPLKGQRDGHDWIPAALEAGAVAYLTEAEPLVEGQGAGAAAVQVADTGAALWALAAHARRQIDAPVIGITGSVAKTTTKDLIRAVLATKLSTHASLRSFNNEIGVPLTLLAAPRGAQALVVELGARAIGDISQLCTVVQPTIGVVTRVAPVHTERFGSLEAVQQAKQELVEALPASGTAVLNADDPLVLSMADRTSAEVIRFGTSEASIGSGASGCDVCAELLELDAGLRPLVRIKLPSGDSFDVRLQARGAHQVPNSAAAAAVAHILGVPAASVAEGLQSAELSPMRMDLTSGRTGIQVLDDSYNANPASTEAALRSLAAISARRRVAVLGVMAELGELEEAEHRRIGQLAVDLGIEVIAVGTRLYGSRAVETTTEALDYLADLGRGDAVLVKGSRVAGLEQVAATLQTGAAEAAES